MNNWINEAKETLGRAKDRAADVAGDIREKAAPAVEKARDRAADVMDDIREKTAPAVEKARDRAADVMDDIKEKTAPAVEKARDCVADAASAVRNGAKRLGLRSDSGAQPDVQNALFDELDAQVREQREAANARAAEMQRRLEELLHGSGRD